VVGVGTQDSLGEAEGFVERHGITFRMLWEDAFVSWQGFGIQRQPASILVSAEGARLKKWQGELDDPTRAEALRIAGAA
jgi:hypothetical protein